MHHTGISDRTDTDQQARQELYRKADQLMKFNRMFSNPRIAFVEKIITRKNLNNPLDKTQYEDYHYIINLCLEVI
jgi:hypothetical protein